MEVALREIIAAVKAGEKGLDDAWLDKLVRRRNRETHDSTRRCAKKRLWPYYLSVKRDDPATWESWGVDEACEARLMRLLKTKPRRTASGVATITVLTKPWPCSSDCLYCPNDVRMPKSYLSDEPACQRAERNYFDPYLQVASRMKALQDMGHVTDKVELIVLGGTWSDYPEPYQIWFISELFRALNEAGAAEMSEHVRRREAFYRSCGMLRGRDELSRAAESLQRAVNAGEASYNQVVGAARRGEKLSRAALMQRAEFGELEARHRANEGAAHRVVGLVIETRPDLIDVPSLLLMRRLGCTKVQMGIQSLDARILELNERRIPPERIARAFDLLRLFGFKIHVHFMVNLPGAAPDSDKEDYRLLVSDERFLPDEVKLYPCCLVESSRLGVLYGKGAWQPYAEDVLVDVLRADVLETPAYTRISRMIRDISSGDIVAGNKKTNLRQLVEAGLRAPGTPAVREIRMREISTQDVSLDDLSLGCLVYRTSVSEERFLQWVTPEGLIAGFLRLSLPKPDAVQRIRAGAEAAGSATGAAKALETAVVCGVESSRCESAFPVRVGEAMIREVHVYGRVAQLHRAGGSAQHQGLGRRLVEEACEQARGAGYTSINVISSVGTRNYYRRLGFSDSGLYQRKALA